MKEEIGPLGKGTGVGTHLLLLWLAFLLARILVLLTATGSPGDVKLYYEQVTAFEPFFVTLSHVAAIAVSLGAVPLELFLAKRSNDPWLGVTVVLAGALAVSKVFSPQFLIFMLPLLAVAFRRLPLSWAVLALPLLVVALTAWLYPGHESDLVALEKKATVALLCRNAAFVALAFLLSIRWIRARSASGEIGTEGWSASIS